eukprot:jgi/Psemu1/21667/gm1.21667_g
MPKKRRTAGVKPQTNKNRKKTLLAQEQSREVNRIHQEDDESRPSARALPQVNYEEVPTDNEEEYAYVDPEAYTESPPARVATSYKRIRQSIALIFEHALETPPAEDWKELNTISFIYDCFKDDRRENGIFYSGKGNYSTTGRPPIIALNSIEAEAVADSIESGNSVRMSTVIVSKYRKKLELPSFTYSAVRGYSEEGETRFKNKGQCLMPCFTPMLDPNGQYAASDKSVLQVKYEREAHFCLGVFMTDDAKGHRLQLQVIAYAKTRKVWIHDDRPPGAIYKNESVQQIPKLKGETFEKLQQHGLVLVSIAAATTGISFNRLLGFANAAAVCLKGNPPPVFDHCQADNPYESLYGSSWEEEVDKVCMVDSVLYMKEKDFYKHCILSELDLMGEQGGVWGSLKLYCNRPVGNRPEAAHHLTQHVALTQGFLDQNKKFLLATPTAVSRTYCHVWTLHPKLETIVKDINKVLCSFPEVADAEGIAIDGIDDRSGKSHLQRGQHEDRGVQKLDNDCYDKGEIKLHEDAEPTGGLILAKAGAKLN